MHSPYPPVSANDERSMYSYVDNTGMAATDMDTTPMPVDAAAAIAAAFGIGFDDMANDRSSPLDPKSRAPTAPPTEPIPSWQNHNAHSEIQHDAQPLDAAAALGASFGIGFDFSGLSGEGYGVSTPLDNHAQTQSWHMNYNATHSSSPSQSPEVSHQSQRQVETTEQQYDAAPALGALVGLRYDGEESRDIRLGNPVQSEVNVNEEVATEEKGSKANEGRTRKKFKKRTGTTRERTGCLTCRQRRKKCDNNTYPICGHCRRLNLECVREAPRPITISVGNSAQTSQQPQPQPNTTSNPYDTQAPTVAPFDIPQPQPTSLVRRHSRNSMSGDLSGIAMHGVNFRIAIPPCLSRPASSDDSSNGGSDRRYLLKYYTQVLASLVTTNHENNSFLSVFLPMAIDSPPLLSALTAWSCAHLSRFHDPYKQPLMHKRGAALRLMAESLAGPSPSLAMQETLLATSLVLCSMEIINGDTEGMWLRHLEGAALIIKNAKAGEKFGPEALRGTGDGEWLLRNFAYHDVLGSVTLGKPPLVRGAYWLEEEGRNGMVDTYMGVGSEILAFISEISCLLVPSRDSNDNTMDLDGITFSQRADELEQGLHAWTAPDAIQPGLVPLAEAWRSAALLCLYRKKRTYLLSQPATTPGSPSGISSQLTTLIHAIARTTTSVLTHLSSIPPSSLPESGLLFPIFLAGGETRDGSEMERIRQRMREMEGFRGFANIGKGMEVLEEVWRCWGTGVRGEGGDEVGWEDVCQRRGWVLMLA